MNAREQEAIILSSTWDMIDSMVNLAMFEDFQCTTDVTLRFKDRAHQTLFSILLVDFLSQLKAFRKRAIPLGLKAPPSNARLSDLTYLYYLRQVCDSPQLGGDVSELRNQTEDFANWLEGEFTTHNVNIHHLEHPLDITVSRYRYLKICGDISKHNLARLETNVGHIRKLIENAGQNISEQDAYLSVESFYEWFFDDIFIGHASMIAEFLNNIRLAIYKYALTEFHRAYTISGMPIYAGAQMYKYDVPSDIAQPIARAMYWDLMNRVRSRPWIERFRISDFWRTHN